MVLHFGIFSLEGSQPYSIFNKCLTLTIESKKILPEELGHFNTYKDECISRIADKLYSMVNFHRASHLRSPENDPQVFNLDENLTYFDVGHFKLTFENLGRLSFEMQIVWLTVNDIGFCFVLNEGESISQAEIAIRLIVQQLHGPVRFALQNDLGARIERINFVLHKFIPDGHIVFMNHRQIRQCERDVESVFKSLSM